MIIVVIASLPYFPLVCFHVSKFACDGKIKKHSPAGERASDIPVFVMLPL